MRLAMFFLSFAAVLWEILLTRIFSAVLFYHFAFMVVSLAMFGLTAGSILILIMDPTAEAQKREIRLAWLALATGLTMPIAVAAQLAMPVIFRMYAAPAVYFLKTCLIATSPFVIAGAFFCLSLSRAKDLGSLYAANLLGAGAACAAAPFFISAVGAPGAVFLAAFAACLAAFVLLFRWRRGPAVLSLALGLAAANFAWLNARGGWLRVRWDHNGPVAEPLYERWNSFSRVSVPPEADWDLFGPALGAKARAKAGKVKQYYLEVDAASRTPMTQFSGDPASVSYLLDDASAFAFRLRPQGNVLILGPGGGRDILAALAAGSKATAVEINPEVVRAVTGEFGDFTGHLDRRPDVRFVVDEGRSYLAGSPDRFDVIQASLTGTMAATSAGAYAFVENGLYTVEAWKLFLSRLKPGGVLSFCRFYFGATPRWPAEIYRTVALAGAALRSAGIRDPKDHVLLVRGRGEGIDFEGFGTILISPSPFSNEDIQHAYDSCAKIECEVAYSPKQSKDPMFDKLLAGDVRWDELPLDVSPPTDDRPFFFFQARISDILRGRRAYALGGDAINMEALDVLTALAVLSLIMGTVLLAGPALWLVFQRRSFGGGRSFLPLSAYFAAIGAAFMFVEMSLMIRWSVFLGHPAYGFTVGLAGLLTAGGAGSYCCDIYGGILEAGRGKRLFLALLASLAALEATSAWMLERNLDAPAPARIAMALLAMSPAAFVMGAALPLGMHLSAKNRREQVAWYWSINGAFSSIGAVFALIGCLSWGIRAIFWTGILLYALAAGAYFVAASRTSSVGGAS